VKKPSSDADGLAAFVYRFAGIFTQNIGVLQFGDIGSWP
jgi:hypothetical protein